MTRNLIICIILVPLFFGCSGIAKTIEINSNLDQQISSLVRQITDGLTQSQSNKIAILPFSDLQKNDSNLGRFIAEELTTKLYQTNRFEVVERTLLEKILSEQKLGVSGYIDDETAISLGKILGVDAIATGTLTDLGSTIKLNARLIKAETGNVISAASVVLYKDNTIYALLGESPKDIQKPLKQSKSKKVRWMQFTFELLEAELEGETLICHFQVTNKSKSDANLRIGSLGRNSSGEVNTQIYDSSGNQYNDIYIRYGDENYTRLVEYPGLIDRNILAEMTVPFDLQITDFSSESSQIPMIQLIVGNYPGYKVAFKKVPIKAL